MVGPPHFSSLSPFNVNDDSSYNVDNTTPELLKFQLQELYRSKLKDLASNLPSLNILHSHVLQGAFNGHLQSTIELGQVQLRDSVPSLSSTPGSDSDIETRLPVSEVEESPNYLNLKILIENSVFEGCDTFIVILERPQTESSRAERTQTLSFLKIQCVAAVFEDHDYQF